MVTRMTEDQFTELYQKHQGLIFSAVIKVLGKSRKHNWQDIASQAWCDIYKSKDKFKGISRLETWASSIAHNVAVDWLKHQKVVEKTIIDDQLGAEIEGPPPFAVAKRLPSIEDYDV